MKNNLGKKLISLRKNKRMTQEQVAEVLKVTRQTISNWELNQTKPDIDQIKEISKFFMISIDELLDTDVKEILTEKISNVEKLTGFVHKLLICILIFGGIFVVIQFLYKMFFEVSVSTFMVQTISCSLDDTNYEINIESEKTNCKKGVCDSVSEADMKVTNITISSPSVWGNNIYIPDLEKYDKFYQVRNVVYGYFEDNGGSCIK